MVTRRLEHLADEHVRCLAHILGPSSAAARAIEDHHQRTERGETVTFYQEGNAILVGPDHRLALREREDPHDR